MSQTWKLDIGNFTAERQANGTFLYKAKETKPLVLNKKPKNKGKDLPQYQIINTLEQSMKQSGEKMILNTVKDIQDYLLNLPQ